MTAVTTWIHTPEAKALGWTLFHFLWEGIAIAAAVAVALLFLRAARARYTAACLGLALMLAACAATFVRVLPEQAARPAPAALRLPPRPPGVDDFASARDPRFHAEDLVPWTVPVWLAGVLLLHLRTIAGWMAVRGLRRSGVCGVPPEWQARAAGLAASVRLSRPVLLLESIRVEVPLAAGYLRPVVLLPLGMLTGMPVDHVEAILLHELAHIGRRDYLVNLLQAVAENLLFYHPAVWWISGVIRAERENCCDDLVVAVRGNAHGYATALTALEARRGSAEPALAATGGNLMRRIHRLLDRPEPPHAALTPAFSAGLVIVTAAVALAAWQPAAQERPPEPERKSGWDPARPAMSPYQKWLTQDVAYIITDQERAAFQQLTTDPEREHFIEQFWLRRDPTPGTPENEFKQEHYRRIAYVNDHFQEPASAGWKTDRGRIYITYGPPDEIEFHPHGDARTPYPYEQFLYKHIDGMGDNVISTFIDPDQSGRYRMVPDPANGSVARDAIWPDTVKRGDMRRQVRGLGTLGVSGAVELKIAETQVHDLSLGQTAAIDFRGPLASGRVARIAPEAVNGTVAVTVQLDAPAPASTQVGQAVDGTINIEILHDVLYVGRPVFGQPNSTVALFKIEPDGQHASAVPVRFGRVSVNQIEILSGLVPGDKVILSDMSRYAGFDRVQLK